MKAAFKIFPSQNNDTDMHLLVEAGAQSISFVIFSKSPLKIIGLLIFNIDKDLLPMEIAAEIDNIISSEPILMEDYASYTIASNFKESVLVPEKYFERDSNAAMLDLVFGGSKAAVYVDKIASYNINNVYRIENIIMEVLEEYFSGTTNVHTTSLQLKKENLNDTTLACIIYHNAVKIILHKDGKLQLVKYFSYNVALDVVYYLLNICKQHDISNEKVVISLSGMVDERSNLYNEIYKYFLNIRFDAMPVDAIYNEDILKYPSHFFSHLSYLASCV
ncbi:MAG: DUF3822 family protein [Ferruginibacter sp.]